VFRHQLKRFCDSLQTLLHAAAQRSGAQFYIQRDIHEDRGLDDAECVGANEAHDAVTVLATADFRERAFRNRGHPTNNR
jgi:hypothetical protein